MPRHNVKCPYKDATKKEGGFVMHTLTAQTSTVKSFSALIPNMVKDNYFGSAVSVFKGLVRAWLLADYNEDGSKYITQSKIKKHSEQNNALETIANRLHEFENVGLIKIVRARNGKLGMKIKSGWLDVLERNYTQWKNALKNQVAKKIESEFLKRLPENVGAKRICDLSLYLLDSTSIPKSNKTSSEHKVENSSLSSGERINQLKKELKQVANLYTGSELSNKAFRILRHYVIENVDRSISKKKSKIIVDVALRAAGVKLKELGSAQYFLSFIKFLQDKISNYLHSLESVFQSGIKAMYAMAFHFLKKYVRERFGWSNGYYLTVEGKITQEQMLKSNNGVFKLTSAEIPESYWTCPPPGVPKTVWKRIRANFEREREQISDYYEEDKELKKFSDDFVQDILKRVEKRMSDEEFNAKRRQELKNQERRERRLLGISEPEYNFIN